MASELQLTKTRLYRVDQDIALAVYQADEGRRSRIVQTVVGLGIERSGLVEDRVLGAYAQLRNGASVQQLIESVQSAVADLDEAAWTAQDSWDAGNGSELSYAVAFAKARAASAVAFAMKKTTKDSLDAVYEASFAIDDLELLRRSVQGVH